MNLIVSTLLPEHRGKWLFFNHDTGECEIIASETEALEKLASRGPGFSVTRIEDRGLQNKPPTIQ